MSVNKQSIIKKHYSITNDSDCIVPTFFCFYFRTNTTPLLPTHRKGLIFWRNMDILLIRGAKLSRNMHLNSGKSELKTYILCTIYTIQDFYVWLGLETTCIYCIGNHHFFIISFNCQTYQNY